MDEVYNYILYIRHRSKLCGIVVIDHMGELEILVVSHKGEYEVLN